MTADQGSAARSAAREHGLHVLGVLSLLMGFASISTDFYLPALPTMSAALRSSPGTLAFTISGYLAGFSVGQLVWGPISDRLGRRGPVALGVALFIVGSAGCALSHSAAELIGWRLFQALGACAGVVLARAMVRDLYAGDRAAQMMSNLMTVMAVAPLVGPLVGAQILSLLGWRAIFWTLVGVGVVTLALIFSLPETLPPSRRNAEPIADAFGRYGPLLRDRRLLGFAGIGGCFYAGTFAYIAGSPFAYITYYHVPAQFYGLLFGAGIVGIMLVNLVNARLVVRLGGVRLLRIGTGVIALGGIVLAIDGRTGFGGLAGLALPLFLFVAMTGLIVANSISGALSAFPLRAGAVSALVGAIQYGSGIVGSALVGALSDGTPWPMALVVGASTLGALLFTQLLRPKTELQRVG